MRTVWVDDGPPVYLLDRRPLFPPPERARPDGLLAVGGDLSVSRLLEAYRHGIFPWFEGDEPILWWCPDPRLVLDPAELKVSRSLRATLRKGLYRTRCDTAFARVVRACAAAPRKDQAGTWISPAIAAAYTELHRLGYAHSVESWAGADLVGGLYGVQLGRCFFGESMFALRPDASKVALVALAERLLVRGVRLIDCQVTTAHLLSLGAREIPRAVFLRRLEEAVDQPTPPERWS